MRLRLPSVLALGLVLALAACVDDETNPVNVTPDAAFVGYTSVDSKQTVCGNCHISKQREWEGTAHANAWDGLQSSSHAGPTCVGCHTTNGASNAGEDGAGYFAVNAASKPLYHDVQCESCHGPGSTHVTAPDDTQPIVGIAADTGMTEGCGTCHTDTHHPFIDEWRSSRHGRVDSHANTNTSCAPCHDARTWLATYAPDAKFTGQNLPITTPANWQPTTCATCHDPHGSEHEADLRLSPSSLDEETNLCITCHHKRGEPDLTTYRGPHSPQGPMVLGTAGWRPAGFTWDSTMSTTHASPTANPGVCGACHVSGFSRTDATTSATVYSTGHTFAAIPCLNAGGAPDWTLKDCEVSTRTFQACATSGCHSTESAARASFVAAESRFDYYARLMWIDVNANSRVDAFPTDSGMAAIAKRDFPADFPTRSATNAPPLSAGEGLAFNARLLWMPGQAAHNAFYGEALALATIQAAKTRYGFPVPPAVATRLAARSAELGVRIR